MSLQELEEVIADIAGVQAAWDESTPLQTMRADLERFYRRYPGSLESEVRKIDAGGVPALLVNKPGDQVKRIVLYLHGGGFATGSAYAYQYFGEWLANVADSGVLLVDYRLVPEYLFPAQLEDARDAYQWLLSEGHQPDNIWLAGDSAGGGLCLALLASLRDNQLPMPACAVLLSPWADLRCSGPSYIENAGVDPVATREMAEAMGQQYVGDGGNLDAPYASPIKMDFQGLPPLLIQVGTREIFLDDSRSICDQAQSAGVTVSCEEYPDMIHQWQLFASQVSEGRDALARIGEFVKANIPE